MPEWNIIITDGLSERGVAVLEAQAQVENRPGIEPEDLLKIVDRFDAMVVRGRTKVTEELLLAAGRLKVVGRAGVGVDNIDLQAAQNQTITVVNAPQASTLAVAELTMALLLNTARAIPSADSAMKQGQWLKKQFMGVELNGKTLGIIGLGNIGQAVAHRARAFGMNILAYDIVSPSLSTGITEVSLELLIAQSDFISIHTPLTDQTRGLIDAETIAAMKPGVRLLCAARGGILDEKALLDGLNSGQVAAVGLDVFAQEPPGLSPLVAHPNVIVTPHIGAQTKEASQRLGVDIAEEILAALRGEELRWRIV